MRFLPEEVLFLHTTDCNLNCPHCHFERKKDVLPVKAALKFVSDCGRLGIKRVGFTGGEPFVAPGFLYAVVQRAVKEGMFFDRIMTNGVWHKDAAHLKSTLRKLFSAGYDGSICVSVDAFHNQNIKKVAGFIRAATAIWKRNDFISLTYTKGYKDSKTMAILKRLSKELEAKFVFIEGKYPCIKNDELFLRIYSTELSPVGKAGKLKGGWSDAWFVEDRCKGPGNIFFVLSNGDVKPCCGYASELPELTIGNIKKDKAVDILRNAGRNPFVKTVFGSGLSSIRKRLERRGVVFPGKAKEHCFFCYHILKFIPKEILLDCLN